MWNSHRWLITHFMKNTWKQVVTKAVFMVISYSTHTEMKLNCHSLYSISAFVTWFRWDTFFPLSKIGAFHLKAEIVAMKTKSHKTAAGRVARYLHSRYSAAGSYARWGLSCRLGEWILKHRRGGNPPAGQADHGSKREDEARLDIPPSPTADSPFCHPCNFLS